MKKLSFNRLLALSVVLVIGCGQSGNSKGQENPDSTIANTATVGSAKKDSTLAIMTVDSPIVVAKADSAKATPQSKTKPDQPQKRVIDGQPPGRQVIKPKTESTKH